MGEAEREQGWSGIVWYLVDKRGNCNLLFLCNPYVVPSLGRASYAWHWGISAHRELGLSFSALCLALGSCNSCFIFTSPTFFSLVKSQSNNQGG